MTYSKFISIVREHYIQNPRMMPWRQIGREGIYDPYHILVSEVMLQQTQVSRVIPKFILFMQTFPTLQVLSDASIVQVLEVWSGLGYNRRALYVQAAAQRIVNDFHAQVPRSVQELSTLPGIGINTAGAILAYAYNIPAIFIETNIRTVYLHHFFANRENITDKQLLPVVSHTVDQDNPREWYWALMDYGAFLKSSKVKSSRQSSTYKKQASFKGSVRELRGNIIKSLLQSPRDIKELSAFIADPRLTSVLGDLVREGMIINHHQRYLLGNGEDAYAKI
ncbi:MAG: endonuclease III [Candidatus Saccharimonadales bacterium]